jgi:hypothetical protein
VLLRALLLRLVPWLRVMQVMQSVRRQRTIAAALTYNTSQTTTASCAASFKSALMHYVCHGRPSRTATASSAAAF